MPLARRVKDLGVFRDTVQTNNLQPLPNLLPPTPPYFLSPKVLNSWCFCQTRHFFDHLTIWFLQLSFLRFAATNVDKLKHFRNKARTHKKKKKKETDHVTPLFRHLYWLPISALNPVQHRLICYTYIHRSTPTHLSDYIQLYTHSRAGDDLQSPPPQQTGNRLPASDFIHRRLQLESLPCRFATHQLFQPLLPKWSFAAGQLGWWWWLWWGIGCVYKVIIVTDTAVKKLIIWNRMTASVLKQDPNKKFQTKAYSF